MEEKKEKEETIIKIKDISFEEEKETIKANLMRNYYFRIKKEELNKIAPWEVKKGELIIKEREKRAWNKIRPIIEKGYEELKHKLRNKECTYIHEETGIPLIGSNEFGLIDRGTNIIEVKPMTGCNLSCNFCSVSEGINNKRDILVEEEYLIKEFKKLASIKENPVEANIGPQGEPLLYPKIIELIRDLKKNGASIVSINTNGTILNEKMIDEMAEAGLDRINLSLHTLNQEKANKMMGGFQDIKKLLRIIKYSEGKIDILLAPVLIPGINDEDIDEIIELSKTIKNKKWPSIGIQNYLEYPGGRNPGVKERSWEEFYGILKKKEEEHKTDLTLKGNNKEKEYFKIRKDNTLKKPFKKGEHIKVIIKAKGRNKDEWIGVANERAITIKKATKDIRKNKEIRVKIIRDKHNIYIATPTRK